MNVMTVISWNLKTHYWYFDKSKYKIAYVLQTISFDILMHDIFNLLDILCITSEY